MVIGIGGIGAGPGIGESYVVTSKTYTSDVIFQLPVNGYYGMSTKILKTCPQSYVLDQLLRKQISLGMPFTTYFSHLVLDFEVTARFISDYRNRVPTDSIINTLYWSWATVLDQSYRNIVNATHSMNVYRADTTDLDILGEVYHLRRFVLESDDDYRNRLIVQTSVLVGHGTKASCEAIVDQINDVAGCNIITGAPATIRIDFDNDDARRAANTNKSTITNVIPNMIAAGITWGLYIDLTDYLVDLVLKGMDECPYTMSELTAKAHDLSYILDSHLVFQLQLMHTIDILMKKSLFKLYNSDIFVQKKNLTFNYSMDEIISKALNLTYLCNPLFKKRNINKSHILDALIKKTELSRFYYFDELVKGSRTSRYGASVEFA